MKKRLTALLLVAVLCLCLAGCAQKTTQSEAAPTEAAAPTEVAAPAEEPAQAEVEETEVPAEAGKTEEPAEATEPAEEEQPVELEGLNSAERAAIFEAQYGPVSLPLADSETITIWAGLDPRTVEIVGTNKPEDVYMLYGNVEEQTGIHIEITGVPAMAQSEKFDLMIAAGDYCDWIYQCGGLYNGGILQALTDEVVIDIYGLIRDEAPIAFNTMMSYDDVLFEYIQADGTMGSVPLLYKEAGTENGGHVVRGDWMTEAGIEDITSIDAFHEYALAAYQNHGGQIFSGNQALGMEILTNAMGWSSGMYQNDETHEVIYGWFQDAGYDFIETCRQWYAEGLMYESFFNVDNAEYQKDFGSGKCSMCQVNGPSGISELYNWAPGGKDSIEIRPIGALGMHDGDEPLMSRQDTIIKEESMAWSCDNPHPELCAQLLNWLYTEQGQLTYNYGKEGVTFEYDAEGSPQFTDMVLNNPNGWSETQALILCTNGSLPSIHDMSKTYYDFEQVQWDAMELFKGLGINRGNIPQAASSLMTTEQSQIINSIQSDIDTYTEETIYGWVCGTQPFDRDIYADFQSTLESMDVQTIIDINQELLDAYYARLAE